MVKIFSSLKLCCSRCDGGFDAERQLFQRCLKLDTALCSTLYLLLVQVPMVLGDDGGYAIRTSISSPFPPTLPLCSHPSNNVIAQRVRLCD